MSKKTILIISGIVVLSLSTFIIKDIYISETVWKNFRSGYWVWADKNIYVYDYAAERKEHFSVDGYDCRRIGKYYGGDFCCIGDKSSDGNAVLLFKQGELEETIDIPYYISQAAVCEDKVFFTSEQASVLYCYDRNTGKTDFIAENIYGSIQVNSAGEVAFCQNNSSDVISFSNTLYLYTDNTIKKLGDVTEVYCWISENELITEKIETERTETENAVTETVNATHYVIDTNENIWTESKVFKDVTSVAAISGKKLICWFTGDPKGSYSPLGCVDFEKQISTSASLNQKPLPTHTRPFNFEWFTENPFNDNQ